MLHVLAQPKALEAHTPTSIHRERPNSPCVSMCLHTSLAENKLYLGTWGCTKVRLTDLLATILQLGTCMTINLPLRPLSLNGHEGCAFRTVSL